MPIITFAGRIGYAVFSGAVLLYLFTETPRFIYNGLSQVSPFIGGSFFDYAITIAFLSGLQIVFKGRFLGDAAAIGNGIAQITYFYLVTNGGFLTVSLASVGVQIAIDFRTILYLLMLPSALIIVSTVIGAASRSSMQNFEDAEEILLK